MFSRVVRLQYELSYEISSKLPAVASGAHLKREHRRIVSRKGGDESDCARDLSRPAPAAGLYAVDSESIELPSAKQFSFQTIHAT
jgi:hypothetical protein